MEPLYAWHQLAADVALAYKLTEESELQMATQLSQAIQTGAVNCWQVNGEPILGAVSLENMRKPVPLLTVAEGNAWLKRAGYLQEWAPAKDRSTKNGTKKRWTEDEVKRLAEYRKNHTEEQTAKHFGVTGKRVREILAKARAQAATQIASQKTNPYSRLVKR
ncbi:MAG: hypothetical protein RLZZ596_2462 [Pseudomonadota bacterium]|jgi:predicted DNA-binding protein (UPF0251 family)